LALRLAFDVVEDPTNDDDQGGEDRNRGRRRPSPFKRVSPEADVVRVRLLFNRIAGPILFVLFAASWLMPGGLNLPGGGSLGGQEVIREVSPPLHSGTPWSAYLAPEGMCRGDSSSTSSQPEQFFAMRCLLDWARSTRGLPRLPMDVSLVRSSELKAGTIASCNDFSHTPCGSDFAATFRAAGWHGSNGENIAWGNSMASSPRVLVDGWLHSGGTARTSSGQSGGHKGSHCSGRARSRARIVRLSGCISSGGSGSADRALCTRDTGLQRVRWLEPRGAQLIELTAEAPTLGVARFVVRFAEPNAAPQAGGPRPHLGRAPTTGQSSRVS